MKAFYDTRDLFCSSIDYSRPLSYSEWMDTPEDLKAAFLYVQFFDQITLAWAKTRSLYTPSEDGVDTILQYLMKNVPVISSDPKRFTEKYIYRVAYNCLYCICHDIKCDKERFELEVSNIKVTGDGEEINLYDNVSNMIDIPDILVSNAFWAAIEDMEDGTIEVINKLLGGTAPTHIIKYKEGTNVTSVKNEVSRKVISPDRQAAIVEELKVRLSSFHPIYIH